MAAKRQSGLVFLDTDHPFIRERVHRKLVVEKVGGCGGNSDGRATLHSLTCDRAGHHRWLCVLTRRGGCA